MNVSEGRKALKELGYKLSAKANPFKFELKTLTITKEGFSYTSGNIITKEAYDQHETALKVLNKIDPVMRD